jgi:hypothetical protein
LEKLRYNIGHAGIIDLDVLSRQSLSSEQFHAHPRGDFKRIPPLAMPFLEDLHWYACDVISRSGCTEFSDWPQIAQFTDLEELAQLGLVGSGRRPVGRVRFHDFQSG